MTKNNNKEMQTSLKRFTEFIVFFEKGINDELKKSSSTKRGHRIGNLIHQLNIENEIIKNILLSYSLRKTTKKGRMRVGGIRKSMDGNNG